MQLVSGLKLNEVILLVGYQQRTTRWWSSGFSAFLELRFVKDLIGCTVQYLHLRKVKYWHLCVSDSFSILLARQIHSRPDFRSIFCQIRQEQKIWSHLLVLLSELMLILRGLRLIPFPVIQTSLRCWLSWTLSRDRRQPAEPGWGSRMKFGNLALHHLLSNEHPTERLPEFILIWTDEVTPVFVTYIVLVIALPSAIIGEVKCFDNLKTFIHSLSSAIKINWIVLEILLSFYVLLLWVFSQTSPH